MHSKRFEQIKTYYNTFKPDGSRMWSKEMVANAVIKGWITAAEYEEITGEKYPDEKE